MKEDTTAATSPCLGTSIHIHVSPVLVTLIPSVGQVGVPVPNQTGCQKHTLTLPTRRWALVVVSLYLWAESTQPLWKCFLEKEKIGNVLIVNVMHREFSGTSQWEVSANSVRFSQMLRFLVCCLQEMKSVTINLSHKGICWIFVDFILRRGVPALILVVTSWEKQIFETSTVCRELLFQLWEFCLHWVRWHIWHTPSWRVSDSSGAVVLCLLWGGELSETALPTHLQKARYHKHFLATKELLPNWFQPSKFFWAVYMCNK